MGAYLSEPVTEKYSSDEGNDFMDVGASSMQGWRISQEDAHNCILSFDEKTSFFAVYDGHGGAEVATYCAEKLPEFLKELKSYKDGDFEQALKDAFLGFDATLLEEDIIDILKKLAGEKNPDRDSELGEEEEEEDLAELCQEGALPIEEVLEKYKGSAGRFPQFARLKKEDPGASGSGTSKPLSPFLRGRRNPVIAMCEENVDGPSCSSSLAPNSEVDSKMETDNVDSTVSSSSSKADNSTPTTEAADGKDKQNEAEEISNSTTSPAVSLAKLLGNKKVQNGDISSCQDNRDDAAVVAGSSSKNEVVSSSSSSAVAAGSGALKPVPSTHENGEVSSLSSSPPSANKIRQSSGSSSSSNITSSTNEGRKAAIAGPGMPEEDTSSSDDDADFQAEDNSSTEDGEEDVDDQAEEDTDEDNEDGETEDDEDCGMDEDFCTKMTEEPGKDSGCTAVVALLHGRDLYVANAGDSRCVVCRKGKAVEMSLDHKPEDEEESNRIMKAGGKVTLDGRVNGGLNLSRAIGDHAYKMNKDLPPECQMISALPDVRKLIISPDDEFMILACDGIWNFMSSDDVVEFIKKRINDGQEKMSKICEELFDSCIAPNTLGDGTGCDNMTAVIIKFRPNITELPTRITSESEAIAAVTSSKRRCSSPTSQSDSEESSENSSKRLKTEDVEDKECDSGSSSSTSDPSVNQATATTT